MDLYRDILVPVGMIVMALVSTICNRFALPKELRPLVDAMVAVAAMMAAFLWLMLGVMRNR